MMTTLYVTEPRALVKRDGDCLTVNIPADKETGRAAQTVRVPLLKIDQVIVCGDATLTSPALVALLEQRTEVCFLTHYGKFRGRLSPEFSKNGLLRLDQHRVHHDAARRLDLAIRFVRGKLANDRTMLLRANRGRDDSVVTQAADRLRRSLVTLDGWLQAKSPPTLTSDETEIDVAATPGDGGEPADPVDGLARLMGVEGAGSAAYFGAFGRLLKTPLGFAGRHKRPPPDPVNAMLSFGYTLLTNQVMSAINVVGLDPYVGFLHSTQYGKPALALDLVEEFRPLIVDSIVLSLINTGAIQEKDFVDELGAVRLTDRGRRTFLEKYEERLSTTIEHPRFGYKATYRRCLELQARLLAKTLKGEIPDYPPFAVR